MLLKTSSDDLPIVNLTPMLDVVFNLIIFFMVGTKFSQMDREIELNTPRVSQAGPLTEGPQRKVVSVHRDGKITLDARLVTLEELTAELRAAKNEYPDLGVLIRGDAQGVLQQVADAISACTNAGVSEKALCVRLADEGVRR